MSYFKMNDVTLAKLETAWSLGCTDLEACLYAGISVATLTKYQKRNPEYLERKNMLKTTLTLKCRGVINDSLDIPEERTATAKWYLERRARSEFATKVELEHGATEDVRKKVQSYLDKMTGGRFNELDENGNKKDKDEDDAGQEDDTCD